jgi:hypothetical protein
MRERLEDMGLWTDPDGRQWVDQPRHCWSPEGRLLSWCSTSRGDALRRHMYRLGRKTIGNDEGEELRERWGGTPD